MLGLLAVTVVLLDYGLDADRRRTLFLEFLISAKSPRFVTGYLAALDTVQHESGPYSAKTFAVLEALDELVGRLRASADVFCVVSDHGFLPSKTELHLNVALSEAGLLDATEEGRLDAWRAIAWSFGGAAAMVVDDASVRGEVHALLERLAREPSHGIEEVSTSTLIPDAPFVVGMRSGFRVGTALSGPLLREGRPGGTHGYLPGGEAMDAAFFLVGSKVPVGVKLDRIDMRDIAPTLAPFLGVSLPSA